MTKDTQQVVVITDSHDAHVKLVQAHSKIPLIIVDPRTLLTNTEQTFSLENGKIVVIYNGQRLGRVRSVWFRKPGYIIPNDLPVANEFKNYAATCMQRHSQMLFSAFCDAQWVNDYFAMCRADSKAWQLEVAASVGLQVPATVMTSNSQTAEAFIRKNDTCIVKPQSAYSPYDETSELSFLTTKINKKSLPDLTNLHLAPAIFQKAVDTDYDVRVTVIGDKVFAAKIFNHGIAADSQILDWRIGHSQGEMHIEEYKDFPSKVADQCRALLKAMHLQFGALDFVMDTAGTLWFLENNANGQWGFVEAKTGQPMAKAMADLLTKGN